jgi:CBS domain-containing protein
MGIVGPITSAAIGMVCIVAAMVVGWNLMTEPESPLMSMLVWLGYINFGLAIFNMIPGFPMDGGRVLRAILWWRTGNALWATRFAATTGQFIAYGFIVLGVLRFFGGAGIGGLWTAFIGWFLLTASQSTSLQAEVTETLRGKNVSDLMTRDCTLVEGNTNVQTFVNDYLLRTGRRCFLIAEKGRVIGLITLNEVKMIPQQRWPFTLLYDVMVPLSRLRTVSPDTPATEALEIIGRENIHQLPVVSDGKLEGMISRDQILAYLMTRAELRMSR